MPYGHRGTLWGDIASDVLLGHGEYFRPDIQHPLVWNARGQFFEAIRRTTPEVVEWLHEDVWPLYRDLESQRAFTLYWITLLRAIEYPQFKDTLQPLVDALRQWAVRANLEEERWTTDEPWVLESALENLYEWEQNPDYREQRVFEPAIRDVPPEDVEKRLFTFKTPAWDPSYQSSRRYKRGVIEQFKTALDEHMKQVEQERQERGWKKAPNKRSPHHFDWLALKQVQGLSYEAIVIEYEQEFEFNLIEASVKEAVKATASLIARLCTKRKDGRDRLGPP